MGISLNHVSFTYQNETIISDLSLDIQQGDCIVLCGASGCGKTTITRIINGLINELYEGTLEGERYLKMIRPITIYLFISFLNVSVLFFKILKRSFSR